jgi:hypothetical protein
MQVAAMFAGYLVCLAVVAWLIGPLLGAMALPLAAIIHERLLLARGFIVGTARTRLMQENPSDPRLTQGWDMVREESVALGQHLVTGGRAVAMGILAAAYPTILLDARPWYYGGVGLLLIWALSRDRVAFPLLYLGVQLLTALLIR